MMGVTVRARIEFYDIHIVYEYIHTYNPYQESPQ